MTVCSMTRSKVHEPLKVGNSAIFKRYLLANNHGFLSYGTIPKAYVFVVQLRISPPRIKLAASHFAQWLMGVQGMES